MPNEKQDLINHKLTATYCKNYTDKEIKKAKDEIINFLSKHNINTIDHTNELAYQITAPAGAKLLQLQAIGGNSVKYEPTFASDDTSALVKTMPSVVYDFDVDKIKGASFKYNQLVNIVSNVSLELKSVTITSDNAQKITLNGTNDTEGGRLNWGTILDKQISLISGHKYFIYISNSLNNINFIFSPTGSETLINLSSETKIYQAVENGTYIIGFNFTKVGTTYNNVSFYLKIIDLTDIFGSGKEPSDVATATPLLKANGYKLDGTDTYSTGEIRNIELSGLKVEGSNLINASDNTISSAGFILSNTILPNDLELGTYTISFNYTGGGALALQCFNTSDTQVGTNTISGIVGRNTITFTTTDKCHYIRIYTNNSSGGTISNITLNRGSNDLGFTPYVSQTLPIDLTSIVDSSGNKLFEDNCLREGDYITPYKASKGCKKLTLNGTEVWALNGTWSSASNISMYTNLSPVGLSNSSAVITKDFTNAGTSEVNSTSVDQYRIGSVLYLNFTAGGGKINEFTLEKAKEWLSNNPLTIQYELETPIEADIDLPQLKGIEGHSNGSITALNTYDMAVPSEIRYNSIIKETLVDSVIVEGANLISEQPTSNTTGTYIYGSYNTYVNIETIKAGTYNIKLFADSLAGAFSLWALNTDDTTSEIIIGGAVASMSTATFLKDIKGIKMYCNTAMTNLHFMISRTTASSYKPYKAPITRNLPTQTSDGYGVNANAHNLRVFSDYEGNAVNKRYTNVDKGNLGDYNYLYRSVEEKFKSTLKIIKNASILLCRKYVYAGNDGYDVQTMNDMTIKSHNASNVIYIKDINYNDAQVFKTAMANEPLYYELADVSKTETDLDYFDFFFDVEEGDVITFNNPYAQQVYATYSFITKEVKPNE